MEVQHLQIDWFDGYGVQVQGLSDHLWLANMAANSEVENGTVPLGFFVHPTGTPVDIHLYNTDANMNYMGYRLMMDASAAGAILRSKTAALTGIGLTGLWTPSMGR